MDLTVCANRIYNGSSIVDVFYITSGGTQKKMRVVLPEFVELESKGFTSPEKSSIFIALCKQKDALLQKPEGTTLHITI